MAKAKKLKKEALIDAKPPGLPVRDWNIRTGKLHPGKTITVCDGCKKDKITDDIIKDGKDNLCSICSMDRVQKSLPLGKAKDLLGKALAKIRNGRT